MAKRRKAMGNHLSLRPELQTQWLLADFDSALHDATNGDLQKATLLWKSICTDAVFRGVFDTFTAGVVALPKKFRGQQRYVEALETGHESVRSLFTEIMPPEQLRLMVSDYLGLGVALGELIEVPGRTFKILKRVDPTFLRYVWSGFGTEDNKTNWYYASALGPIPVTPGDGRWVLWAQASHAEPWTRGFWTAAGRIFIEKQHAILAAINYQRTLANAGIILTSPQGANESDRNDWFEGGANWGLNTVLSAPPGYGATLLQGSGVGYETFDTTIKRCNEEMIVLVAGNRVTTQGNSGFSSSNLYETIRDDRIRSTAESLADFINLQILPQWVVSEYGLAEIENTPCIAFDVAPPMDPVQLADAWTKISQALPLIEQWVASHGEQLDFGEVIRNARIPIKLTRETEPDIELEQIESEETDIDLADLEAA